MILYSLTWYRYLVFYTGSTPLSHYPCMQYVFMNHTAPVERHLVRSGDIECPVPCSLFPPFHRCELHGTAIVWSKSHVQTAEDISLPASINVRIAEEEVTHSVVGVPIGTEEYGVVSAVGAVRDGGVDCLTRCLAGMMTDKRSF